ncbi:hypothetical protein HYU82_02195 [Candidatus Saccharibacteria bacterium]|nr:hypothetical protein [Candidatus Saccharibacteria bacterium]
MSSVNGYVNPLMLGRLFVFHDSGLARFGGRFLTPGPPRYFCYCLVVEAKTGV